MHKININGIVRKMTAEEVAELKRLEAALTVPEQSEEQRLDEIEAALMELAGLLTEVMSNG